MIYIILHTSLSHSLSPLYKLQNPKQNIRNEKEKIGKTVQKKNKKHILSIFHLHFLMAFDVCLMMFLFIEVPARTLRFVCTLERETQFEGNSQGYLAVYRK